MDRVPVSADLIGNGANLDAGGERIIRLQQTAQSDVGTGRDIPDANDAEQKTDDRKTRQDPL